MTTLYGFKQDCIDVDNLRDNASDGGTPSWVVDKLYTTIELARIAMLEHANGEIEEYNADADEEDKHPLLTHEDIKENEIICEKMGFSYNILTFEVQA